MKIKLILILIFITFKFYSQQDDKYYLSIYNLDITVNQFCHISNAEVRFFIYDPDGNMSEVYRENLSSSNGQANLSKSIVYNSGYDKVISSIRVWLSVSEYSSTMDYECSGGNNYYDHQVDLNNTCISNSTSYNNNPVNINFNYSFGPNISIIQPEDNTMMTDQSINAEVTSGFDASMYNWEYQVGSLSRDDRDWHSIPNSSSYLLTQSINDFLRGEDYIGQKIYFRVKTCENFTTQIIIYTIIASPPKLVNKTPTPIKTRCSYTSDGSFKINFDRQLINEKLIISVYFKNFDSGNFEFYKQEDTVNLVDNGNATYSYTWLGLNDGFLDPVEEYKVKYQALKDVSDSLPSTDPSWTGALESNPFTIPTAIAIDFSVIKLNDETCFESGDGQVQVEINQGEQDRDYYYQLKKNGVPQVFNGISWDEYSEGDIEETWIPFIGRDSTIINMLDKGSYKIKVRDSNTCYAKNE
ncbi:hypothetical protein [Tenacibaculum sp. IB213877]|uniref:hypothetical protein n=1 Tax=Tenacibaculum sp. IB213877 TaxID=3097351 RepID=UPI002A59E6B0|nr:hypothetical protein [Tenacibaculum sp. IB213877]MDY0779348.1 hypothetical protein [Tenacibaculum sp. IB213877]